MNIFNVLMINYEWSITIYLLTSNYKTERWDTGSVLQDLVTVVPFVLILYTTFSGNEHNELDDGPNFTWGQ